MATYTAPQEQTHETEIAIVGCGPVGAMLANLLGLQGIATLVLEREAAIYNLPRAVNFDGEVMRLFQTVDLAEAMQPLVHACPGMKFVDDAGRLLLDWSRPLELGPQAWHASYRFHQPELERVLRDGLARFPSVEVRLRTEVFALDQAPDAVVVRYEDLATGGLARCRARSPGHLCARHRRPASVGDHGATRRGRRHDHPARPRVRAAEALGGA
jgi:3-(3-hydroxy-phenyl)propionate hydroxylase